jgi:hypothetical protein
MRPALSAPVYLLNAPLAAPAGSDAHTSEVGQMNGREHSDNPVFPGVM